MTRFRGRKTKLITMKITATTLMLNVTRKKKTVMTLMSNTARKMTMAKMKTISRLR